jgi:hypothetical protein
MQKQIIELGFNKKKMETKTSAKWTKKWFLLEEIWRWSLCLDEFVGRGEFRSRRWVAATICPWWKWKSSRNLQWVWWCVRESSFWFLFKRKRIPPLWRVINNRDVKGNSKHQSYVLFGWDEILRKKGVWREAQIPTNKKPSLQISV